MTEHSADSDAAKHLLIFGATSVVGRYLLPLLGSSGFRVTAVTRAPAGDLQQHFPWVVWQLDSLPHAAPVADSVTHILSLGPCDAFVIWLGKQKSSPALRQIIAFGSTSALTKLDSDSADERELANRLLAAESALASECQRVGARHTLLRPTLIYGGAQDLIARIGDFAARWHGYPLPLGPAGAALRQPVHAADLAQATLNAIDCAAAMDQTIDLPGGQILSMAHMIKAAAKARTRWALPLPLPLALLLGTAAQLGWFGTAAALNGGSLTRMAQDQVFDSSSASRILGFRPRRFSP